MLKISVEDIAGHIREVAETEILPRFCKLREGDIAFKIGDDPVTIADKEAEKALSNRFLALLPGSKVVGEEAFADNPQLLECFFGESPVWIIDPIDGTRNFVAGKTTFGVIVGLAQRNEMVAGWLYDPMSGQYIAAERGAGAYLFGKAAEQENFCERTKGSQITSKEDETFPEFAPKRKEASSSAAQKDETFPEFSPERKKTSPRKVKVLSSKIGDAKLIGSPGGRLTKAYQKTGCPDGPFAPRVETGLMSACHEYARLLASAPDFSAKGPQWHFRMSLTACTPWDDAAGFLIHHEAGGYGAHWDETPFRPSSLDKGYVLAPDRDAWLRLRTWAQSLGDPRVPSSSS